MSTEDRRLQLLNLLQTALPALVESLVRPEPPKPKVEHIVKAYSFAYSGTLSNVPLEPPEGEGWKLSQLDLPSGLGHWTRVVLVESEEKDTISSPPPDLETSPTASEDPPKETPAVPCLACGQMPHASTCSAK